MMHAFHDYRSARHAESFSGRFAALRDGLRRKEDIFQHLYGTTSLLSHRFARLKQNAKVVP
jgi:hypothetical protein